MVNDAAHRRRRTFATVRANFELLTLTLPALIAFLLFNYLPMGGVIVAFKRYRYDTGILHSPWIGLANFSFFFRSVDAWRITRNTVAYSTAFIIVGTITAVVIALLLLEVRSTGAKKVYQTVMILPRFLSWVVISFITYAILNPVHGVGNQIIVALGGTGIDWYSHTQYWPFILTISHVWNSVGITSIIYYAVLMGVDPQLYEAASIDGASWLQQTWHVSIPALVPVITILNILAIGNLFTGDFGLFYQIPRDVGRLYPVTDIINTYVYRGLRQGDIGRTAAVGLFQSSVGLVLIIVTNAIVRRMSPENALF